MHRKAVGLLPGGVTHDVRLAEPFPLAIARAQGARKWDVDGMLKLAGHFHGWHDQMATGSDPPFDQPDTAGLPAEVAASTRVVPADASALAEAVSARDVAAIILEPTGAAWGTART